MIKTPILYDADCGFCKWALHKVLAWDRRGRLQPIAIQSPEGQQLLAGLEPERRLDSWHLVTGGHVLSAGAAAPALLRLLPGGRPLAALSAALPGPTERAYRLVANNRALLARLLRINRG